MWKGETQRVPTGHGISELSWNFETCIPDWECQEILKIPCRSNGISGNFTKRSLYRNVPKNLLQLISHTFTALDGGYQPSYGHFVHSKAVGKPDNSSLFRTPQRLKMT